MQAMILSAPPQARQISISMLNSRFRRYTQVIEAWRSAGVGASESLLEARWFPLPRFDGVTKARCLLFGANTP